MAVPTTRAEYIKDIERRIYQGLLPSHNDEGRCAYRADGTASCEKRCVAGILIPDYKYDRIIEGRVCANGLVPERLQLPEGVILDEVCQLQAWHDALSDKAARDKIMLSFRATAFARYKPD